MFVRTARETDVPAIATICTEHWQGVSEHDIGADPVEAVVADRFDERTIRKEVRFPDDWHGWVVAVEDDEIVAAGGGGMTDSAAGEVYSLFVHPEWFGSGARTALLQTMTAQQVVDGAREQWASCVDGDDSALSFYSEHGFDVATRRSHDGTSVETVRFVRSV
ncbi:GNAT family N-acetyltransferase [Haloferax namakaokahaiae]|uniref:GNAT family N-acetyltransferase n=1 Tax=Haloferax namakaokahaiae TaxID=1748331 RepID=A0ABD5ZC52_9EURY